VGDSPGEGLGVEAAGTLLFVVAAVFRAVVCGQDQVVERDAPELQVGREAFYGQGGAGGGEFVGVIDEEGAGFDVADGVLVAGEALSAHLGPVGGDIVERFGIGLEAFERQVLDLDGAQVVFLAGLGASFSGQAVLPEDTGDGAQGGSKIEQKFKAARSEAGDLMPGLEDLFFLSRAGFMGAGLGGAGVIDQGGAAAFSKALQPAADGLERGAEGADGRTDAVALGVEDHLQAQGKFVVLSADHVVVWDRGQGPVSSLSTC